MLQPFTLDAPARPAPPADNDFTAISLDDRLRDFETQLIQWALRITGGNKSKAAKLLNIKRSTLGDRINRCGLNEGNGDGAAAGARS